MSIRINRRKAWSVADTEQTYTDQKGRLRYRVIGRFDTQWQAEEFVDKQSPDKLQRGVLEICGPSEEG